MVSNLIGGKWYTSKKWGTDNTFKFIAKYKGVDKDGNFSYSERIKEGYYEKESGYSNRDEKDWDSFYEITFEELSKYLPHNHPDLMPKIHEIW